jgi:hypothetical protein
MKGNGESEKQSSVDALIEARALEMLDEAALELLAANGLV